MTGTNFLNTPDERPGWADYFMSEGYVVRTKGSVRTSLRSLITGLHT